MNHPCPEPQNLLALLDGTLPDDAQAVLSNHLDDCPQCQRDLEDLAGGTEWLRDKLVNLDEQSAAGPGALHDVVQALQGAGPEQTGADEHLAADDLSLDFLEPSETPGRLGRLGPYEVIEAIGSGGMGVVLKAFEPSLNRPVAIKVLNPALASNATARKRFVREAQAAAAVSHDHVVTIHAVDEANGLPYLVMQYVSGLSLEEKLKREGPLEVKEVLRIGMQAAAGLAAAHAQGLIHRDIKPANILLENGVERVKITDFGLARAVDDASVTESGIVTGTPQYMAPEQARGETVDHRADLFSLGSVLYAMCTGRPPFRGSQTLVVLRRVADERPPSVQRVNPEVPDWLAEIVARLHERDPERRFQSADEVARVLGGHLSRLQQPAGSGVSLDAAGGMGSLSAAGGMGSLSALGPRHPGKGGQAAHATRNDKRGRSLASALSATGRRRWLVAAVLLAVLAGGLGVTEATDVTGVTEFVATVLRIRTPQGTLVVKVDDPEIEVAVEGDGETITLRGAGAHEIRLRPGRHKVEALRDGRPLATQWATITRGGKEVVTVGLEETEKPSDAATAGREQPTALYAGRTLDEWLAEVKIEREPERLAKAIHAIGALRDTGRDREIAKAIVEQMRRYDLAIINSTPEQAAVQAFGQLTSDAAIDVLREALKSHNESERRLALWVLSREERAPILARAKEFIPAIIVASRDEDPDIRTHAMRLAIEIDATADEVVPRLREALADAEPGVRSLATQWLAKLAPDTEGLVEALIVFARWNDSPWQFSAIGDLRQLGLRAAKAVPDLIESLRELQAGPPSDNIRRPSGHFTHFQRLVIRALGAIGPAAKEAISLIEKDLEHADPQIRAAAAEALQKIKAE